MASKYSWKYSVVSGEGGFGLPSCCANVKISTQSKKVSQLLSGLLVSGFASA